MVEKRGRGRPRKEFPELRAMDAGDVFMTFKQRGSSIAEAAKLTMFAAIVQREGWEGLGLSERRLHDVKQMFYHYGIDPLRVNFAGLNAWAMGNIAETTKKNIQEANRKDQLEAMGVDASGDNDNSSWDSVSLPNGKLQPS